MNNDEYTTLKELYYNTLNKLNDAFYKEDIERINHLRDHLNILVNKMIKVIDKHNKILA